MEEDDEDDYLKMEFKDIPDEKSRILGYSDIRKRKLREQEERAQTKSSHVIEIERRDEKLNESLFLRESFKRSKALDIMKRMGYVEGQVLGISETEPVNNQKEDPDKAIPPEPIPIQVKNSGDRSGIGHATEQKRKLAEAIKALEQEQETHIADFIDVKRSEKEKEHLAKNLLAAMRICEQIELDPDQDSSKMALKDINVVWRALLRDRRRLTHDHKLRSMLLGKEDRNKLMVGIIPSMGNDAEKTKVIEECEEEDIDNEDKELEAFESLDIYDRLELVLDYLREKHYYCFWCGTRYQDQDDMDSSCPGPDEEQH